MKAIAAVIPTAARLVRNGFRYRLLRRTGRPGRPQAISLEVTHRCVCHCVMCNIWKIPATVPDLSLHDWVTLLSSDVVRDLRELDVTGGEPFLRDDLVPLVRSVCRLKTTNLRSLRSVAITTNGVLTERVLVMVEEMLGHMREAGLDLVMVCGFDAVGEQHDRIRRYEGAWVQVDQTVAGLTELRERYPNLVVGLKTTVLPQNVGELEKIAAYAHERGLFTIISPAIVTSGRYLNPDKERDLALSPADRERLAAFYEGSSFAWSHHARVVHDYLRTGRVQKPCTCGFNYFFVRSDGSLHLCPLFTETVGNVTDGALGSLLDPAAARTMRRHIGRSPECDHCTEPGLERYSLPYEGFAYLRTLFRLGPRAFIEQHRHLGLDKYV